MNRPIPPASLLALSDLSMLGIRLAPAPDVLEWLQAEILSDTGSIHNPDHAHLIEAPLRIMWASSCFEKQGRTVLGQAEQVAFRAGGWQKARMEQQMLDWFGEVPAFIITLAGPTGLDYNAIPITARMLGIKQRQARESFHDLRVMEAEALRVMREK